MIEQHDIQETLDELRGELGLGGTFDSHQFIEKYRATQEERANTRNDHGNNTGNQVWRFLSMILIVIASLMPQHIFAQDNAKDMSIIFRHISHIFSFFGNL